MKSRMIISVIAFLLLPFASAFAVEAEKTAGTETVTTDAVQALPGSGTLHGEIGGTAEVVHINGNKAKFSEYRDMRDQGGFYGNIRLGYDSDDYWMKLKAQDMFYKDQSYNVDGGMYGKFKAGFFYNEIIHNITFGAITPYSGAGGGSLTYTGASPSKNTSTWNSFDYSIQRKQLGGDIKIDVLKPFYFDFSATNEYRHGILPIAAGTGMNSPGAFIELPAPISYTTNNIMGEIGYAAKPVMASVNFLYSNFTNDNHVLSYESILSTRTDATTLPPDNDYYRIGFKGSLQLPLNTRFNVNLANAHASSHFDLLQSYLLTGTTPVSLVTSPNSLSSTVFNGKKDIENYQFVLTTNPVTFLDGKVFYKYYKTTNKSDQITAVDTNNTTTASAPGFTFTNDLFDYKKNSLGGNLGFRLPARFYFDAGYKYEDVDRLRNDIPKTKDNIYSAELRWNGLDWVTPRIGYERLQRTATGATAAGLADNFAVDTWFRRFDAAAQHKDTYKAVADFSPLDNLNLGAAYKYKNATYPESILGLRSSKTNEFDVYGDYLFGGIIRLNAYFDLQDTKTFTFERYFNSTSMDPNPNNPPVSAPAATTSNITGTAYNAYNWNMTIKDYTYNYGAGVDVYIIPNKLALRLQYDYINSNGFDDLTYLPSSTSNLPQSALNNLGANNSNIDIPNFDDYKKSSFMAKLTYAASKSFSMAVGASYESYKYNDVSFDNYQNFVGSGANIGYLSGVYSNPSYNASVVFLSAAYKF